MISAPKTLLLCCLLMMTASAFAGSRQLGTGAATQIEGSSGSGIVPWATITGYSEAEESDFTASYTYVDTDDYELSVGSVALGWRNRIELSFAKQELDLITLGPAIGLPGASLKQDVIGIKARLFGNLVYSRAPQVTLGLQYKDVDDFTIPAAVGAVDDNGLDYYLSATKLFLGEPAGFNGFATLTLRSTKANETGLLGFGGDLDNSRSIQVESSLGVFVNKRWAVGVDYREKPSNLSFARESDWRDFFVAYFPNRHLSIVAAYVDLGGIATLPDQTGIYLSIQGSF